VLVVLVVAAAATTYIWAYILVDYVHYAIWRSGSGSGFGIIGFRARLWFLLLHHSPNTSLPKRLLFLFVCNMNDPLKHVCTGLVKYWEKAFKMTLYSYSI